MLLALSSAARSSDLSRLSIKGRHLSEDKLILGLSKQSKANHLPSPIEFRAFSNHKLCPVRCFKDCEESTRTLRSGEASQLFLGVTKPHAPVVSSTIARWLKLVLSSSEVDTSYFSAHSTRGAAASTASIAGITTKQIMATADWSSASTFRDFYYREDVWAHRKSFDIGLLSSASKSHCDIEPEPDDVQSENG